MIIECNCPPKNFNIECFYPAEDNFIETLETLSKDAYIFSAPETLD